MKIVLTSEVRRLGAPGDVIEVADGYARNFLIPRRLALRATRGTLQQVETIRRTREIRELANLEQAQQVAAQLEALSVKIPAKSGENGRLFGQITPAQVAEAITKAGGPKIDRKRLQFATPIKNLGAHTVHLRLHPEVEAGINLEIVRA